MKPIKLLVITAAVFMMNNAYAVQYKFVAMDNSKYTKMCVQAGNNEKEALKRSFRREQANSNFIANTTRCNGLYIANFAQKYHANLTYDFLKKHTRKNNLNPDTEVTIKDIAFHEAKNKLSEDIILVYVGH